MVRGNDWIRLALCGTVLVLAACYREPPPEVPEFRAPRGVEEPIATAAEVHRDTGPAPVMVEAPVVEAAPVVAAPPPVVAAPSATEAAPPPLAEAAPAAPSILGSWRVTQVMEPSGQLEQMPPDMTMTLTFTADGQVSMQQTMGAMTNSDTGTYTINGDQITLVVQGEPQSGTFTVTATQLTLTLQEATVRCERV